MCNVLLGFGEAVCLLLSEDLVMLHSGNAKMLMDSFNTKLKALQCLQPP